MSEKLISFIALSQTCKCITEWLLRITIALLLRLTKQCISQKTINFQNSSNYKLFITFLNDNQIHTNWNNFIANSDNMCSTTHRINFWSISCKVARYHWPYGSLISQISSLAKPFYRINNSHKQSDLAKEDYFLNHPSFGNKYWKLSKWIKWTKHWKRAPLKIREFPLIIRHFINYFR